MFAYYKDQFNNTYVLHHNQTADSHTVLQIICTRENKPISNQDILIANDQYSYQTTTNAYGEVEVEIEPGLYTIQVDNYIIEKNIIANITNIININAQYSIFGLLYNNTITDSEKSLTYCDDSLLVKDWNTENLFLNIKPCIFKNGKRQFYLNPNDLTQTEDGQTIDISNPMIGDVMIEIPKIGIRFDTFEGQQRIQVTNNPNLLSEGFHYYAHTRDNEGDRDYLYIGAFLGTQYDNQLMSLGFSPIITTTNLGTIRNYIQSKGQGYDLLSFYPYVLLQILFLLKYKNLNSQKALGMGYTSLLNTTYSITGNTYNKGIDYGTTDSTQQMKFLHIEDLWGNNYCYIDGIYYNNYNITTAFKNFNNNGTNYQNQNNSVKNTLDGYLSKSTFSSECGFLPLVATNDPYIYYSDKIQRTNNTGIVVGGKYNSSYDAGLFNSHAHSLNNNVSVRLMYL